MPGTVAASVRTASSVTLFVSRYTQIERPNPVSVDPVTDTSCPIQTTKNVLKPPLLLLIPYSRLE
jgi:hypothetical protein